MDVFFSLAGAVALFAVFCVFALFVALALDATTLGFTAVFLLGAAVFFGITINLGKFVIFQINSKLTNLCQVSQMVSGVELTDLEI